MTGTSYRRSAELAGIVGPYEGYARNADAHTRVMRKHAAANDAIRTVHQLDKDVHKHATTAWDGVLKIGEQERLAQRAGLGARADRHHRLHDGLRHHRHRAGLLAGQVQEAGRRRLDADRQPDDPAGAAQARLHRGDGRGDRRVHRRERSRHRRARPEAGALRGVRHRDGRAGDQADGPRADDGGGAAVPVRRDLQDGQPAGDGDGRGDRRRLLAGLEARPQGARGLPRQLQGRPAAVGRARRRRRSDAAETGTSRRRSSRRSSSTGRSASGCRSRGRRGPRRSRSAAPRAT